MTDWPASIDIGNTLETRSYREKPDSNRATFETAVGPPKVRRRSTLNGASMSFMLMLTKAQLDTLDTFFRDTLKDGVMPFNMRHPRTDATASFRFSGDPEYQPVSHTHYQVKVEMRKVA